MSAPSRTGSWETITTALDQAVGAGRPSGDWTKYCCPVHEGDGRGHRPSLGVKYDSGQQRTVVRCFAGCDNELVLGALGLQVRDMFDRKLSRSEPGQARPARPRARPVSRAERALTAAGMPTVQPRKPERGAQTSPWKVTATYPYLLENGSVVGEVIRREATFEHGRDKEFHQRHWDPETGRMENGGFAPVPYQLPQVLETIAAGGVVYICEGEKDVAAAESAGLTATTNAGGAVGWGPEHAKWLEGASTVVIVADADPAGYRRAERVMTTLSGLVQRVRVVRAATGKDLFDHLQCGHEIAELEPIPYLDPYTRPPTPAKAARDTAPVAGQESTPESSAAETGPVSAAVSTPEGDPDMGKYMMAPDLDEAPAHGGGEVEQISGQWSRMMQLLLNHLLQAAARKAATRARDMATLEQREQADRRATEERLAAERKAAETRLQAMADRGWHTASRDELADAITQARAWAPDSEIAKDSWYGIRAHLFREYGIYVGDNDEIEPQAGPAELSAQIADKQAVRVRDMRARRAHDRMVEAVAAEEGLDESTKQRLYADIRNWSQSPNAEALDALSKKLTEAKVPEKTRTEIRFVGVYLSSQGQPIDAARGTRAPSLSATHLLRSMDTPLVDLGEEVKPRVDRLLVSYQDQLRAGHATELIRDQLATAISVMTPEDQEAARARGAAIRKDPTKTFAPMWPDHVDRDQLTTSVQMYAALRPQADRMVVTAGDYAARDAAVLRQQADKHRKKIQAAIRDGKGLHALERDQLDMALRDIDAGLATPAMLFVDDRTAAAADAERADAGARTTARYEHREAEKLLTAAGVDAEQARVIKAEIGGVMQDQVHLGAGRVGLYDYGEYGRQDQLAATMAGAGIPEGVRNRVMNHVDKAATEAAITGKQNHRIAERWAERRQAVIDTRNPAPAADTDRNSLAHRVAFRTRLQELGLTADQIDQRLAAEAGRGKPRSAAVGFTPGERTTTPGEGVHRVHHLSKGRGPELDR
jgi:hypothetical protein